MDAEESGLTLQGLAQRLEALESENAELRRKVDVLRGAEPLRSGRPTPGSPESVGRVSRRELLSKAGVAAAGLVVAGALTQRDIREARAAPGTFDSGDAATPAVKGKHTFGGIGVLGEGLYGVEGDSDGDTGQGVHGNNRASDDGVLGDSTGGAGVRARSFGGTTGAVVGQHFGRGYGGQFSGARAQLRLVPGGRAGRPGGAHSKGESTWTQTRLCSCASGEASRARGGRSPPRRRTDDPISSQGMGTVFSPLACLIQPYSKGASSRKYGYRLAPVLLA